MHITCKISRMLYFTLYFELKYMRLSYSRVPFIILREFPSNDVAQGLIGKPKVPGTPNQIFFVYCMDYTNIFIIFC